MKFHSGKSARIIVTMGMPGSLYRWYFRAHSLHSLQRNILDFIGFRRVRALVIWQRRLTHRGQKDRIPRDRSRPGPRGTLIDDDAHARTCVRLRGAPVDAR